MSSDRPGSGRLAPEIIAPLFRDSYAIHVREVCQAIASIDSLEDLDRFERAFDERLRVMDREGSQLSPSASSSAMRRTFIPLSHEDLDIVFAAIKCRIQELLAEHSEDPDRPQSRRREPSANTATGYPSPFFRSGKVG